MKTYQFLILAAVVTLLAACSTPKVGYFQNVEPGQSYQLPTPKVITAQPGDKISILVSSRNPELAYMFNVPAVSRYNPKQISTTHEATNIAYYTVDSNGDIDFPIFGKMHLAGMNREEIASYIKGRLVGSEMIKDPTVTVDFLNLYYSVLGEVRSPGRQGIDQDKVTIIDAISQAGDLTIHGKRDNILITRTEGNTQKYYTVNLGDAQSIYNSPAYYIQPGDIIYVEPTSRRARESSNFANTFMSPTLWISIVTLSINLIYFIKRI